MGGDLGFSPGRVDIVFAEASYGCPPQCVDNILMLTCPREVVKSNLCVCEHEDIHYFVFVCYGPSPGRVRQSPGRVDMVFIVRNSGCVFGRLSPDRVPHAPL